MSTNNAESVEPWFSDRSGSVVFYKVNRRPLPQGNLFGEQPENVLDHLVEVLLFGEEIRTQGRGSERHWLLGNRSIDVESQFVFGHVGWERVDPRPTDRYDARSKQWKDAIDERETTARSVFGFDGVTRELAVALHPTFNVSTVARVFRELLNVGEAERESPTTEWDVEPILDTKDFQLWLRETQVVDSVTFVAKLPNPDGLEEFDPVFSRLIAHRARLLREVMEAGDPDVGLVNLEEDPTTQAYIAMAGSGFGYVTGTGTNLDRGTRYDQRQQTLRRHTEFPESWGELVILIREFLQERRRGSGES